MARWWTITVPPQFQDITAEAMQEPAFKAGIDKIKTSGGTAVVQFWADDTTALLTLDSTFADMPASRAVIDGFENGARKASYGSGKELAYSVETDAFFVVARQHAKGSSGEEMWMQRWTARGTDDALHSLGIVCTGTETACKPLLGSVKVDPKDFVKLSSLRSGDGSAYRIGYGVGVGLVCAFFVAVFMKIRQRRRAISG